MCARSRIACKLSSLNNRGGRRGGAGRDPTRESSCAAHQIEELQECKKRTPGNTAVPLPGLRASCIGLWHSVALPCLGIAQQWSIVGRGAPLESFRDTQACARAGVRHLGKAVTDCLIVRHARRQLRRHAMLKSESGQVGCFGRPCLRLLLLVARVVSRLGSRLRRNCRAAEACARHGPARLGLQRTVRSVVEGTL